MRVIHAGMSLRNAFMSLRSARMGLIHAGMRLTSARMRLRSANVDHVIIHVSTGAKTLSVVRVVVVVDETVSPRVFRLRQRLEQRRHQTRGSLLHPKGPAPRLPFRHVDAAALGRIRLELLMEPRRGRQVVNEGVHLEVQAEAS